MCHVQGNAVLFCFLYFGLELYDGPLLLHFPSALNSWSQTQTFLCTAFIYFSLSSLAFSAPFSSSFSFSLSLSCCIIITLHLRLSEAKHSPLSSSPSPHPYLSFTLSLLNYEDRQWQGLCPALLYFSDTFTFPFCGDFFFSLRFFILTTYIVRFLFLFKWGRCITAKQM